MNTAKSASAFNAFTLTTYPYLTQELTYTSKYNVWASVYN